MQRSSSHGCGGQKAVCGVPGNAGRHRYSGPLIIIPGCAGEAGGVQEH